MSASPALDIPNDVATQTTPLLVGSLLNYALYGALSVQVYIYRICFPKDRPAIKGLVYAIYLLETVQVCLNAADVNFWFGPGYGDPNKLLKNHILPIETHIFGSIVGLISQLFFCYRIWILRRSYLWFCIAIACISIAHAGGGMGAGIKSSMEKYFSTAAPAVQVQISMWLIGGTVADLLIAATMMNLLWKSRLGKEHKRINDVLTQIMTLTLETNALTASVQITSLVTVYGFSAYSFYTCPLLIIGKVYSNSLLITFNNRLLVRNADSNHEQYVSGVASRGIEFAVSENSTIDPGHLESGGVVSSIPYSTARTV